MINMFSGRGSGIGLLGAPNEIVELVSSIPTTGEIVVSWAELPSDDIIVCLCKADLYRECQVLQSQPQEIIGFGRTLLFRKTDEKWAYCNDGSWGSGGMGVGWFKRFYERKLRMDQSLEAAEGFELAKLWISASCSANRLLVGAVWW